MTVEAPPKGGIGESVRRPDGIPKVKGEFAYSSDLWADGMLWGATLRSPHPRARIRELNIAPALAVPGVHAVLTHEDVPGRKTYGLEIPDQPVLAWDQVRYQGEPIAIVAADHPETARRAAAKIEVDLEPLTPITDPEHAFDAEPLHPSGNLLRHVHIEHGDPDATAEVVVTGEYEVGMQDQAFLGPESGLAVPAEDGGVDLFVSTQWLHVDRDQVAASLDLPPDKVRITLGGVGGAFGAREDLSMQVHACLLALHTGKPVKMMYGREESFFGHVHRHPARMRYEHGATRDGDLVYVKARILLDGGAYASSSTAVCSNAASFACGPYDVPNALIDSYVVYTDNPPCGAMRGFGAVQTCFAHEAQMDKLAAALDMDPVELRRRNALAEGGVIPTGATIRCPAPVDELLASVSARPLPGPSEIMPGGHSNTTHGEGVRRGIGYAVGYKNVGYSEGFDDYSTARVRLSLVGGEPLVEVHTAAAEVGQGLVTVQEQIARHELGVERVIVLPADTQVGSVGFELGLAPDVHDRRRGQARVRGGAGGARAARRLAGRADRHHARAPPSPDAAARRQGPGRRARDVRVRRPPRGGRRRHRARARARGRDRHRPGRGSRDQPAGGRGADRGRHRAGARAGADGGDPGRRRAGPQRVVHRLPDPDRARHAAGRARRARAGRPGRAVRAARGRRAADHLLHPRDRRRPARGDGRAAHPRAGPSRRHRGPVMPVPPAELTAEFSVAGPEAALAAARAVAGPSGLARETGPGVEALIGSRDAVLETLDAVVRAALDAGAHRLDVRLEAPAESR